MTLKNMVWNILFRRVVPNDSIVEHVVALVVEDTAVIGHEHKSPSGRGAGNGNPAPNEVKGKHFVPNVILVLSLFHKRFKSVGLSHIVVMIHLFHTVKERSRWKGHSWRLWSWHGVEHVVNQVVDGVVKGLHHEFNGPHYKLNFFVLHFVFSEKYYY